MIFLKLFLCLLTLTLSKVLPTPSAGEPPEQQEEQQVELVPWKRGEEVYVHTTGDAHHHPDPVKSACNNGPTAVEH